MGREKRNRRGDTVTGGRVEKEWEEREREGGEREKERERR